MKKRAARKKKPTDVRVPELGADIGMLLCGATPDGGHQGLTDGDYLLLLCGNSKGFRKLGQYLLKLSELDTTNDPSFHHHFGLVRSLSGTKLELMVRKNKAAHYDWMR
jgi:hypothetical protein